MKRQHYKIQSFDSGTPTNINLMAMQCEVGITTHTKKKYFYLGGILINFFFLLYFISTTTTNL